MKGPKYIETNLQTLMARKLEYYKHIQTLKNIKCDPTIGLKVICIVILVSEQTNVILINFKYK